MTTGYAAGPRTDAASIVRDGTVAGVIAGLAFAAFEMAMAAILDGMEMTFMPLRMIGGIGLGTQAMDPATSLLVAGGAGLVIHMALAIAYGIGAVVVLSRIPALSSSTPRVLLSTSAAGFLLWIVNFYALAPVFGWTWFPNDTNPIVQIVAHTVFFGTVLGVALDRLHFPRAAKGGSASV